MELETIVEKLKIKKPKRRNPKIPWKTENRKKAKKLKLKSIHIDKSITNVLPGSYPLWKEQQPEKSKPIEYLPQIPYNHTNNYKSIEFKLRPKKTIEYKYRLKPRYKTDRLQGRQKGFRGRKWTRRPKRIEIIFKREYKTQYRK